MTRTVATHPGRQALSLRRRPMRRPLAVTALGVALVGVGGVAAPASATAVPAAFATVESCTAVTATATYNPGLTPTARNQTITLSGTLSGCTDRTGAAQPGAGTINGVLTGSSRVGAVSGRGNVTINWPASSGLNPSTGTLGLTGPAAGNTFALSGTFTSGAYTGSLVGTTFVVARTTGSGTNRRPVTGHGFTNTLPLTVRQNLG
jgi:hypothetical protein